MLFDFDASKDTWYIPTELPLSAISAVSPLEKALLYVAYPPPKPPVILGPNIIGAIDLHGNSTDACIDSFGVPSGAFDAVNENAKTCSMGGMAMCFVGFSFSASKSNVMYQDDVATVQPKALVFNYVIKY